MKLVMVNRGTISSKGDTMNRRKTIALLSLIAGTIVLFGNAVYAQSNVLIGKPALASSWDSIGFGANGKGLSAPLANDGDPGTRWATDWNNDVNKDSGWIYMDLQGEHTIDSMIIIWETAGAVHYAIQVANFTDPLSQDTLALLATDTAWTTVAEITDGTSGETRTITFAPTVAHQVRVRGYSRTTTFGYSIWELKVFDPTLAAAPFAAQRLPRAGAVVTPSSIRFFAPGITGCALFDLSGRRLLDVNQQAAGSLSIAPSAVRGGLQNGFVIARLTGKNGVTTQRLMIAR
jgi:hypothetical protein